MTRQRWWGVVLVSALLVWCSTFGGRVPFTHTYAGGILAGCAFSWLMLGEEIDE